MHQVVGTFTADGFRVGLDNSRACFSPDGKYVSAGSVDGTIYIWNVSKGKLEHSIKEHNKEVHSVLWHTSGKYFLSAERSKRCFLWTES
ncbi:WD40 repeat domain-containing protein [Salmonella sp. s51228]|uniref:WD40 repeat domain-containing protein n=1 Tax=Salmonella sp. s51228 TaxID=3159652 RepID=UPI003980DFB2